MSLPTFKADYRTSRKIILLVVLLILSGVWINSFSSQPAKVTSSGTTQLGRDETNVPMKIGDKFDIVRTEGVATITTSEAVTARGMERQADPVITFKGDPTVDSLHDAATLAAQYLGKPASSLSDDYVLAHNALFQVVYGGSADLKSNQLACIQTLGSMMTDTGVLAVHSSILDMTFTNGNVDRACHFDTGYDTQHDTLSKPFDPTIGK